MLPHIYVVLASYDCDYSYVDADVVGMSWFGTGCTATSQGGTFAILVNRAASYNTTWICGACLYDCDYWSHGENDVTSQLLRPSCGGSCHEDVVSERVGLLCLIFIILAGVGYNHGACLISYI